MALQDTVRALARIPILGDLDPDALRLIAYSAETKILRAGDVLFRRDDVSDCGFVILSGAIMLTGDRGAATIATAPALIGETALVAETRRPADAIAREPSSVMKISRALFHRVLTEYPDSAMRVRHFLAERLRTTQNDLDTIAALAFSGEPKF